MSKVVRDNINNRGILYRFVLRGGSVLEGFLVSVRDSLYSVMTDDGVREFLSDDLYFYSEVR